MQDLNPLDAPRVWNRQVVNAPQVQTRMGNNRQRRNPNVGQQVQQNNGLPPVDYQNLVNTELAKFSNDLDMAKQLKRQFTEKNVFARESEEFERASQDVIVGRNRGQFDQALVDKVKVLRVKTNALIGARAALERQVVLTNAPAMKQLVNFKDRSFPEGGALELARRKDLEAGAEFKKFIAALGKLEKAKTLPNIEALEGAANAYLNHAEHKNSDDTEHRRKKKAQCEQALKHAKLLRMALQYEALGKPPWDPPSESKAAEIRAVSIFETGGKAKQLDPGEAGTSGSWFVETQLYQPGKGEEVTKKSLFIFKPTDAEDEYEPGWEKNGGAIREVSAKLMSDNVRATTGIDLGISPSFLVKISNDQLPDQGNVDDTKPPQRIGVMQQLAPNDGDLKKALDTTRDDYDPIAAQAFENDLKQIPPAELGKVIWADFLTMNHDRHAGNVLIDRTNKKLIPIDHGKCMPPTLALAVKSRKEIDEKNIINKLATEGRLPQADQKLPDDMIEQIQLHDPLAMAQQLKNQRDSLKNGSPEDKEAAEKLSDEAIDLSARSAYFFKVACKELTVRQLAQAQSRFLYMVLAADPDGVDRACQDAIAKAKAATAAETRLGQLYPELLNNDQRTIIADLTPLGWPGKAVDDYLRLDPDFLLKVARDRLVAPLTQRGIDEALAGLQKLNVPPPNLPNTLDPEARKKALATALSNAEAQAVRQTATGLGLDLDRTVELQNLQLQLQQIDNGPLKTRADEASQDRLQARNALNNANDENRNELQTEFDRLDREWTQARNAVNNAKNPITKRIDEINEEIGIAKTQATTFLNWGGDEKLRSLGKNPANLSPAQKLKACDEAVVAEYNHLGGDTELARAKPYGQVLRRTPGEKLAFLKAWIEFRDNALRNNALYKLGLSPAPGDLITTNLKQYKDELARANLDATH